MLMDVREICAEKIRAVAQRARYRDFYDLYFLINELDIDFEDALRLLKQKEIRTPVISTNIWNNWSVAKEQSERDLGSIYCTEELANREIESFLQEVLRPDFQVG